MKHLLLACASLALPVASLLAGCGASSPFASSTSSTPAAFAITGRVHGGQQPVVGSAIQLYTVGTTGDGSTATSLLNATVTTDSNGNFTIANPPSCTAATNVYLVARGGNPGVATANPNLALMTALGPCTALSSFSSISVNELTTVAAVYALAPYISSITGVGSSPGNVQAMNAAFSLANQLVNASTGVLQSPAGTVFIPAAQINTLADILAACVNSSGGTANSATICGELFGLTTPLHGAPPADTIAALLNIAQNPTLNVASLYYLLTAAAPYQPTSPITPPDLAVQQTPSANAASGLQIGPSSLTFPSANVEVAAPSETVVISNPTTAAVSFTGFTFSGTNAADFAETNSCGTTLAASASCVVTLTFTPQGSGMRTAALSVASSTPDSPQLVSLAGKSTIAVLNGPHAAVDTPLVRIYPGASYDVTLSNTGNAPLVIASISLAGTPFNIETNNCPATLNAGASCVITIRSIAAGADQLTITTNDPTSPTDVLVFQGSNAPTAVFTPSDVFFADTPVGTKAQYTYTYNPNATVTPKISGPQASEFSATAPVCTQGFYPTTPPTCRFSITFNPNAAGLRSAKLALDTSGNYLPLAGMATTESSTGLSFEDPYLPYYPLPQPILLVNKGTSSVTLTSIGFQTITGPVEFTETNNCGATLAPNASCTITVLTTRLAEGGTQALLTATTDTTSSTLVLDNSLYPVINLGAIADDNTGNAAYPVPGPFTYVDYSGLFAASYIQNPQVFSFTSCPVGTGTCAGEVGYKPTQIGMQVGTLVLFGPGPSYFSAGTNEAVQQYVVVGTGVTTEPGAKLLLSQNGFATFPGTTAVNTSTLTLINPGSHTLELTGPMLSGSTPQNFALGQASCLRGSSTTKNMASVPPGMQCTIPITFNSKQTGFSTATATVTDSISGLSFSTPLYVATLVGPSLAPSSLSFPSTVVNTVSAPQSITVTRDLTHPITTSSSGGIIATKGACAAGEDPCTLSFVYAPTSTADSPIVSVQDVALGSSTALPVTATALRAVVHSSVLASPGYLTFPSQTVGTVSATQTITLTSEGPGVLNLYSFGFADGSAGQFTQSNNCSAMLAVNASCTVVVSFAPTSAGNKYDAIVVNASSNTGLPLSLPLSGVAR